MHWLRTYYQLSKPGIVYGNALAAVGGYLFAAGLDEPWWQFVMVIVGLMLVMASACVFNNIIDRDVDAKMERTASRALPSRQVSITAAFLYASIILAIGEVSLALISPLAALIALFGHFAYVVVYTYSKRKTVHSTLIGTISGATPPVIGYVAVTQALDSTALLLFLILVTWQMPHFYAIGIFRRKQYEAAGLPILPIARGFAATRLEMIVYTVLFTLSVLSLTLFGRATIVFGFVMALVGLRWLQLSLQRPMAQERWARKQFGFSLYVLLILSVMLSLDGIALRPLLH